MSRQRCTLVLIALLALGGAWYVTPPGSPPLSAAQAVKPEEKNQEEKAPALRCFELAEILEKTIDYPGIDTKETKLGEELERLQKVHRLTFIVNEKAFAAEGLTNVFDTKITDLLPIAPMKTTLRTVLRQILARVPAKSGATYLIRNYIEITTEHAVRVEFGMPPAKGPERLPPMVSRQFFKKPIKSCFDDLSELSGVNVVFDVRAEAQAERSITARFLNVPIDTAVGLVADMVGLKAVRRDNVFYVTTPENAAKQRKDRERTTKERRRHRGGEGDIVPQGVAPVES
jgi:hypothetical protein